MRITGTPNEQEANHSAVSEFVENFVGLSDTRQKLYDEYLKLLASSVLSEFKTCRTVTIDELLAPIREELSCLQTEMDGQYFDEESQQSEL